jgi:hypothetical protein
MLKDFSLPIGTVDQILKVLFEGEEQIESPEELAREIDLETETIWKALDNSSLTEQIRHRCIASVWVAVPGIIKVLLEKAIEGSLPHARLLLDVSGLLSKARQEATMIDEENEFDQLSQEEFINYIYRALDFAKESRPGPHSP